MDERELARELRRRLADQLAARSVLRSPEWRNAIERVPREVFLGGQIFRRLSGREDALWEIISEHDTDPRTWLTTAYEDETLVTQLKLMGMVPPGVNAVSGVP